MGTIVISDGPFRAAIEPAIGAGLSEFSMAGPNGRADILRPAVGADRFTNLSMYLMCPWTNRIAGAWFSFAGVEHRLHPDWEDGSAIHGDVKDRLWRIVDRSPVSASLAIESRDIKRAELAVGVRALMRYEVSPEGLRCDLGVRNLGETPMPCRARISSVL